VFLVNSAQKRQLNMRMSETQNLCFCVPQIVSTFKGGGGLNVPSSAATAASSGRHIYGTCKSSSGSINLGRIRKILFLREIIIKNLIGNY
jgi:hypothetical protein